ncbi:hypothetical protein [Yunchengibacter salinarum]|uniref:hypothetical protein n=1 Tax=Yunchengibacter salinarum TaxID=3133399 RepID=UPI0035B571E6
MAEQKPVVTKDDLHHDPDADATTPSGGAGESGGEPVPDHTALKWVVGVLGMAIVVMVVLILGTLAYRAFQDDPAPDGGPVNGASSSAAGGAEAPANLPDNLSVTVPEGMTLAASSLGADGRTLLLHYEAAGRPAILQLVDRRTGQVQTVRLNAGGDPKP